ncbi:hypothetical protein GCM10010387_05770 [Streptomyces inusitatus]|uniref:Uncharacterized protein n=1 Tax=Streptomyces inusitatus TaxID=68221 RepID=A0A918UK15_9ACTN|nr:hypothetical protein [Streptomyces inusitatus]GGZ16124.1 hypothetical protein GCM10010387_05770 [Streptomyces inusitatus]
MRTKLIGLTGILAAAALALGIGVTVQGNVAEPPAAQQILADNQSPASIKL